MKRADCGQLNAVISRPVAGQATRKQVGQYRDQGTSYQGHTGGPTFHVPYTAATEAPADTIESTVVTHEAPGAPHRGIAAKCAANPMGASNPVSARTQPGLSAAISVAVVTAISSLAKPAKIKSDRNGAAGANARPTRRIVIAGVAPATIAAKGTRQMANRIASCASCRAKGKLAVTNGMREGGQQAPARTRSQQPWDDRKILSGPVDPREGCCRS